MKEVIKDAEQKNRLAFRKETKSSGDGSVDCGTPHLVAVIRSRTVPPAVVSHYAAKIVSLEDRIKEVLVAEKIARLDRLAEMEVVRAENIIKHSEEIKSRPPREWLSSSGSMKEEKEVDDAQKKQHQMQGLKSSTSTGNHRMTRKKRRAREAREALLSLKAQHKEGVMADVENNKSITETSIKVLAKAQKKSKKEEERTHKRSIHDDDVNRDEKNRVRKKSKGILGRDASGDGGLFDEEKITFARKNEEKTVPSAYSFRGYDPNKKFGKGGKKGHNTFKSKKRFKRRK
jgi:hypothetical protein